MAGRRSSEGEMSNSKPNVVGLVEGKLQILRDNNDKPTAIRDRTGCLLFLHPATKYDDQQERYERECKQAEDLAQFIFSALESLTQRCEGNDWPECPVCGLVGNLEGHRCKAQPVDKITQAHLDCNAVLDASEDYQIALERIAELEAEIDGYQRDALRSTVRRNELIDDLTERDKRIAELEQDRHNLTIQKERAAANLKTERIAYEELIAHLKEKPR
jgi:hypothetical protein